MQRPPAGSVIMVMPTMLTGEALVACFSSVEPMKRLAGKSDPTADQIEKWTPEKMLPELEVMDSDK